MDVFAYVVEEDRGVTDRNWYQVKPSDMYPVTIARIREVVKLDIVPEELVAKTPDYPGANLRALAYNYVSNAKQFADTDWELALTPRVEVKDPISILRRAQALEFARKYFVKALHCAVDGSIGLHILDDPNYRH